MLHVRGPRTDLLRAARTSGTGQFAPGRPLPYVRRIHTSFGRIAPHVPRTVACHPRCGDGLCRACFELASDKEGCPAIRGCSVCEAFVCASCCGEEQPIASLGLPVRELPQLVRGPSSSSSWFVALVVVAGS